MTIGGTVAGIVVLVILWLGYDAYKTLYKASERPDEEDDTSKFYHDYFDNKN